MSCYHRFIFYFLKGFGCNVCNKVRGDILYNTDVIISIVKLIVHSSVGKLV